MSNYMSDSMYLGYSSPDETAGGELATPQAAHRRGMLFCAGLLWGLITAFSLLSEGEGVVGGTANTVDMLGLALAIVLVRVAGGTFAAGWNHFLTWMFLIHAVVGAMSAFVIEPKVFYVLKMFLFLPALATVISVASLGWRALNTFRIGITLAGVVFMIYHLYYIDYGQLMHAKYRLYLFLNSNGVAYISMMTGLSLLNFIVSRLRARRGIVGVFFLSAGVFGCAVVCFATKSRNAALAFTVGILVTTALAAKKGRLLLAFLAVGFVGYLLMPGVVSDAADSISDVYELHSSTRDISGGTGRFETWGRAITKGVIPHPLIGIGPGVEYSEEFSKEIGNVHNAILQSLVETGILGTLPVLVVLGLCGRRAVTHFADPRYHFAIVFLAAALSESLAEVMLFSIGNPAGLLFLMSMAVLTSRRLEHDAVAPELEQHSDGLPEYAY